MSSKTNGCGIEQRTQAMTALMVLVMFILLIQLWLITIALEEHLAAQTHFAWPTFGASLFCLAINLGLLKYLYGIDRKES
jgi:hypothetical protein